MATLTLQTNITCAISINGGFLGILYKEKPITIPLPADYTFFSAIPENSDYPCLNYFLTCQGEIRLITCSGRLCKWNDDIYELFFVFNKSTPPPPPVILKEGLWGQQTVGLCGGYFLKENGNGYDYFPKNIDDYEIISKNFVLLKSDDTVYIVNENMEEVLQRKNCTYEKSGDNLILNFTPGDMDFFTVRQIFNNKIISSEIIQADCQNTFDRLRCFCQAIRLNVNCEGFLTPSLLSQMSIENIKDFLGIFDQTDQCRYLATNCETALALRYMVDPCNFHYICYQFKMDSATNLIDDIFEI